VSCEQRKAEVTPTGGRVNPRCLECNNFCGGWINLSFERPAKVPGASVRGFAEIDLFFSFAAPGPFCRKSPHNPVGSLFYAQVRPTARLFLALTCANFRPLEPPATFDTLAQAARFTPEGRYDRIQLGANTREVPLAAGAGQGQDTGRRLGRIIRRGRGRLILPAPRIC
jgi:hypothetical protein